MQRAPLAASFALLVLPPAGGAAQAATGATYDTVIEKLARGEPVIGGTIDTADPDTYCAVRTPASLHVDRDAAQRAHVLGGRGHDLGMPWSAGAGTGRGSLRMKGS